MIVALTGSFLMIGLILVGTAHGQPGLTLAGVGLLGLGYIVNLLDQYYINSAYRNAQPLKGFWDQYENIRLLAFAASVIVGTGSYVFAIKILWEKI